MLGLASQRRNKEENVKALRNQGQIPGVLYGPKTQATTVKVNEKEFQKVYEEAGESSFIQLDSHNGAAAVLIRDIQRDPVKGKVIHVDFYQPPLNEAIEVAIPVVFQGESPAMRDFKGTLLKNIQAVNVKALPQNLPHEIMVDISKLATFEDRILVRDLAQSKDVQILRDQDEVVAQVVETKDVEAELEQPVVENVEAVEQVKEEKKEAKTEEEQGGAQKEEQK
ncbi:MAG: 50S ribosomal protein L25 [Patescibacteria group bacterium]